MSTPVKINSSEATTYVLAITCEEMKDAEDYLQEFILAWLDTAMNDDTTAFDVSLGLLRTIQQVFTFNNVQKCLDYVRSIAEKRAFLVLSCTIDEQLLNDFIDLPQLEYIYVFGKEAILKNDHSKLVEVTSIQKLYSRLSTDARLSTEEDDDTDFASLTSKAAIKSIQDLEGDARIFVFYQLLIEILLHLPKTPELKEQFISFCMEKTNNNPAQQEIFQKLIENYKPEKAISWYSNPCFFHKLLNRTCRLGHIKDMFKLAFFMVDLNAQLKNLHNEYFDCYAEKVHVYRGRPMSTMEFEKLQASIGDLVVTKSFLSTTTEKDVARMYSGADTQKPDFVPAILHMVIDKQRNETKPFAYTRYHSKVREDDEILISIGTIFRITAENSEKGIHEFTLIRGDAEKNVECEIKNAFRDQARENDAFFHLDSSTDVNECYKQVLEVLTSSNDHIIEPSESTLSSKITEEINTGSETIIASPVVWQIPKTDRRFKRISEEISMLEEVKHLFILDVGPTYDTPLVSSGSSAASLQSSQNIIMKGRILPQSQPYCQRSFRISLVLPPMYSFEPPILRFMDPMYHPNISNNGKICSYLLNKHDGYNPTVTLSKIIINVEQLISDFDENLVINLEVHQQYKDDRDEFNRKALDFVLRYGHPRI